MEYREDTERADRAVKALIGDVMPNSLNEYSDILNALTQTIVLILDLCFWDQKSAEDGLNNTILLSARRRLKTHYALKKGAN